MRAIFISYRREDAEGQAGRLFDDLAKHFGENAVFMDVAGIAAGRDFRRVIEEHVASCGVLLAMIGKNWLDAKDESGARRLEDAADFVRLETASALKRDIPVVPVLVQGARMPRKDQLPEDLAELAFRNGVELTHARWDSDVEVLIKALSPHVQSAKKNPPPAGPEPARRWPKVVLGSVGAIAVAIAGYMWQQSSSRRAEEQRFTEENKKQAKLIESQRLAEERKKQAELIERQRLAEERKKPAELIDRRRQEVFRVIR
jgi:TIR domain